MFKVHTIHLTIDGQPFALDYARSVSQSEAERYVRRAYPDATDVRFEGSYGEPCDRVRDSIREVSAPVR